ncbi:MAG: hypothetical protein LBS59_07115 [Puniceicoccales bacterium]|nr:hypothetical protein [Puniceicoccales bacterium]
MTSREPIHRRTTRRASARVRIASPRWSVAKLRTATPPPPAPELTTDADGRPIRKYTKTYTRSSHSRTITALVNQQGQLFNTIDIPEQKKAPGKPRA